MQQQQQQQWINRALLPGGPWWRTSEQGVSSSQRTAQEEAPVPGRGRRRRGAEARGCWVSVAVMLGTFLLLPGGAWSFLSEEQEELIVELHNHYRGMVSPSASAMLPLKWDPSLKVIAEGYAAKCVWNHNPELEETGENLFANTGPLDLREALEKWFFENLDYDYNNNSCPEDKMCGHYTQMVWANTHRVGCAWHLCNTMDGLLDFERANFLVCNYYPAGNYDDEKPYIEGEWCSSCPENLQKCENNLCVADTPEEDGGDDDDDDDDGEGDLAVTDGGMVTPPPETPPPATPASPSSSSEEEEEQPSPNTPPPPPPPPQPPTPEATQPPAPSSPPHPPTPPGREEEEEEEEEEEISEENEVDQPGDPHRKGGREGPSAKPREREANREKETTISVSDAAAGSSLRSTVSGLVLVLLTVALVVRG